MNIAFSARMTSLCAVDVKKAGMVHTAKSIVRSHTAFRSRVTKQRENACLVKVVGLGNTAKISVLEIVISAQILALAKSVNLGFMDIYAIPHVQQDAKIAIGMGNVKHAWRVLRGWTVHARPRNV